MTARSTQTVHRLVRATPSAAGIAVAALGALVLIGWAIDSTVLKSFGWGRVSMKANTALGFVLIGTGLTLLARGTRAAGGDRRSVGAGRALGAVVALLAVATLAQYATGLDLGIDQILFEERAGAVATPSPGRMALNTALAFLLAGAAALAVGRPTAHRLGELLAAVSAFIGFQGVVGYALDVGILYGLPNATAMAIHTAGALTVLALGLLLVDPERGYMAIAVDRGAGGVAFRRLIPVALLGPLAIGAAARWASRWLALDDRFVLSLVVSLLTLLVVLAVGATATRLRDVDRHRVDLLDAERELRAELEAALERAEEANEAKSAFLATVSHELRTPLSAIIGYTELLKEGIPQPLHEAQQRPVERVGLSARHLKRLIEEILAFARLEAGREEVSEEEVSLEELTAEIEAVIEPLASEKELELRVTSHNAPVSVRTDPNKLRQILLNLLGNAVKFTDEGQVALAVRAEDGDVVFDVSDTGRGIPAEDLQKLFEPFWRGDPSNTASEGGTGLGLTISSRYAELIGAELDVESQPGAGTVFRLRLRGHP